jgi:hypothetical protein
LSKNEVPDIEEPYVDISVDTYERMCALLYAYRFGTISFLELLDKFEEMLNIRPPPTTSPQHLSEKE